MRWLALLPLAGCSFHPGSNPDARGASDGDPGDAADAPGLLIDAPAVNSVAHVPDPVITGFDGTASVTWANVTIDTRANPMPPMITVGALPAGARFVTSAQLSGGPELVILELGDLTVTGTVTVIGSRPLVIIARTTIDVATGATIDASAVHDAPGGGGYPAGMGPGAGGDGVIVGSADSGGGGAGFGTAGGAGQASGTATAGTAGVVYGTTDLLRLEGGSGGGAPVPACNDQPSGAGGGAIQLYAGTSITITGSVRANGGGGLGGNDCVGVGSSGAGGGAGGAIYLQAPMLLGSGLVLAQGGGGGGAMDISTQTNGGDGQDGKATIAAASGGTAAGTGVALEDNRGASGGYRDAKPSPLVGLSGAMSGNGGGGGGAVGRIVIRSASAGAVATSPTAVVVAP